MTGARQRALSALTLAAVFVGLTALTLAVLGIPASDVLQLFTAGEVSYVVRTVLAGALVVGVAGGVLGAFAVTRGQSLLGDAVSHSALPGIYLMFMAWSVLGLAGLTVGAVTLPPARSLAVVLLGALVTGLLAMVLIVTTARHTKLKEDAALGLTLSIFFGAGIALRSFLQNHPQAFGNRAGLESFLFGSAATMTRADVIVMAIPTVIAVTLVVVLWKELKLLSFDPDYLATLGYPVQRLDLLLTGLIVVAVIVGLQMVGVILMSALLIAPAVGARQWTDRFAHMVVLAAFFGAASGFIGVLASSLRANVATGPIIAVFATSLALASIMVAPNRGVLWRAFKRAGMRRRFATDTLLLHLSQQGRVLRTAELAGQMGWSARRQRAAVGRAASAGWVETSAETVRLTDAGQTRVVELIRHLRADGTAGP